MITNVFINALGQAIFESCGQALLIYVALQLSTRLFPSLSSKYRYDINYLGLTIITCWFAANLVNIYLHNADLTKYSVLLRASHLHNGIKNLPTVLQEVEAVMSTYAKYITGLYMIGLLLKVFKLMGGFVHIHQIRKQKNLSADSFWTAKAYSLSEKLKIAKSVALLFSEKINVPLTIGYLKPVIIFPLALISNLDPEQVEAILLHELAHIKRHDYLLNILQCIMETLLCFNPFVWLIAKTIRQEREYCCDDMVINEDFDNFNYSRALFIIAQQNSQNYTLAMASTGKNKYPLLNRIKRLNNMKTNDSLSKTHLLVIIAIAATGSMLAWGVPQYSMAKTRARKPNKVVLMPSTILTKSSLQAPKSQIKIVFSDSTASNTNDSLKRQKKSFKIVTEDDKGVKKEYNALQELPDSEKKEFVRENPEVSSMQLDNDSLRIENFRDLKITPAIQTQILAMKIAAEKMAKEFKNNPEWNKQVLAMTRQAEKINKQFNNPEWIKQIADIQLRAAKIDARANSPEFKKQIEEMDIQANKITNEQINSEWKKSANKMKIQADKMRAEFNSSDWKKQMKDIKMQAGQISKQVNSVQFKNQMEDIQIQADKMSKKFNSVEWKKQMEDLPQEIKKAVDDQVKAAQDSAKTAN